MRAWVGKYPVASYYLIAVAISWSYWLTLLAYGARVEPGSAASHLPGLLGPAIAAILVTALTGGAGELSELFARAWKLRPPRLTKILLALSPLALGAITFTVLSVFGRPVPGLEAFSHYPGVPDSWPLVLVVVASLVVNGFGEEAGWRGYATEKLLVRYGGFRATVLVAGLWALWHLPVFWLNTNMTSLIGPQLFGWAFGLLCGAFVLTQVYLLCGHSVLCAALWHTAYNMMVATQAGQGLPAAVISTLVMVWGIVVAIRWWRAPPQDDPPDIAAKARR
jgi:membrane protease YdiL (CAAX protease family)